MSKFVLWFRETGGEPVQLGIFDSEKAAREAAQNECSRADTDADLLDWDDMEASCVAGDYLIEVTQ